MGMGLHENLGVDGKNKWHRYRWGRGSAIIFEECDICVLEDTNGCSAVMAHFRFCKV